MVVGSGDADAGTREGFILVLTPPPIEDARLRREELAGFLRARREGLRPDDVGLPGGGRRRTPGLRREELATLAGVGTTWYTWLEQGRDVQASLAVLEALAQALRLSPTERAHMIRLGRGEPAPPLRPQKETVSPALRRLIDSLNPTPVYLLGRRFDFLAYNRAAAVLFSELERVPPAERNHLWLVFMHPAWRELYPDWESNARRLLGRFRASYAERVGDPAFESLLEQLLAGSAEFREWWPRHEVVASGEGRKTIEHPIAGHLEFEHAVFLRAENSEQRLVLYSPRPGTDTAEKVAALLAERGAEALEQEPAGR
jgi:transcriptional regulator with XRE-family HTH domain